MDTQNLSSLAQRGQSQLEGTVAAARNVLAHFAADVSTPQRDGVNEPNGQSMASSVQTFVSAKDVYLACSRELRETITEIGNRRTLQRETRFPSHRPEAYRPSPGHMKPALTKHRLRLALGHSPPIPLTRSSQLYHGLCSTVTHTRLDLFPAARTSGCVRHSTG